jgi:hypothetical protein
MRWVIYDQDLPKSMGGTRGELLAGNRLRTVEAETAEAALRKDWAAFIADHQGNSKPIAKLWTVEFHGNRYFSKLPDCEGGWCCAVAAE